MGSILDSITPHLPEGWHLSNLIFLDPDWQVNISNDEHIIVGTGDDPESALAHAASKTDDPSKYLGRLFSLPRYDEPEDGRGESLLARLGLVKKREAITRRV